MGIPFLLASSCTTGTQLTGQSVSNCLPAGWGGPCNMDNCQAGCLDYNGLCHWRGCLDDIFLFGWLGICKSLSFNTYCKNTPPSIDASDPLEFCGWRTYLSVEFIHLWDALVSQFSSMDPSPPPPSFLIYQMVKSWVLSVSHATKLPPDALHAKSTPTFTPLIKHFLTCPEYNWAWCLIEPKKPHSAFYFAIPWGSPLNILKQVLMDSWVTCLMFCQINWNNWSNAHLDFADSQSVPMGRTTSLCGYIMIWPAKSIWDITMFVAISDGSVALVTE